MDSKLLEVSDAVLDQSQFFAAPVEFAVLLLEFRLEGIKRGEVGPHIHHDKTVRVFLVSSEDRLPVASTIAEQLCPRTIRAVVRLKLGPAFRTRMELPHDVEHARILPCSGQ